MSIQQVSESEMDNRSYWFNFRTCQYDYRECPTDFRDYISQDPSAQALYRLYQDVRGDSPIEAAIRILKLSAGVATTEEESKE